MLQSDKLQAIQHTQQVTNECSAQNICYIPKKTAAVNSEHYWENGFQWLFSKEKTSISNAINQILF